MDKKGSHKLGASVKTPFFRKNSSFKIVGTRALSAIVDHTIQMYIQLETVHKETVSDNSDTRNKIKSKQLFSFLIFLKIFLSCKTF